jgi:hypothetical protein
MKKGKFCHLKGKLREDNFSVHKPALQRQQNSFTVARKSKGLGTFCSISNYCITIACKDNEFVKECVL